MNDYPVNNRPSVFILFSLLLAVFSFTIVSCSDSLPRVVNVNSSVVFQYDDDVSEPQVCLSVFAQCDSDVRRIGNIKLISDDTFREWNCSNVELISGKNNKTWAGCSRFTAGSGELIPQGRYSIYIEDMADNEAESSFLVSYPENFMKCRSGNFPAAITVNYTKMTAVYDGNDCLLYYGERNDDLATDAGLSSKYPEAVKTRICYQVNGTNVVCIMPPVTLKNKTSEE